MKLKKTLYPKTKRIAEFNSKVTITEKLDGSNLTLFKLHGELHIAQRNYIFSLSDITAVKNPNKDLYKGLVGWLTLNAADLENDLHEGACICGEWLGMGKLKYGETFNSRFLQFAKANVDTDMNIRNIVYSKELFKWSFVSKLQPEYISEVPTVKETHTVPTINYLDSLYTEYCDEVARDVEGFVITVNNSVMKYVRMKNGKLTDHRD